MTDTTKHVERVVFIGAGFSAPLNYPIGAQLPRTLIQRLKQNSDSLQEDPDGCTSLLKDLQELLRRYFRPGGEPLDKEELSQSLDVAEFYSVAQALSETPALLIPTNLTDPYSRTVVRLRTLYTRIAAATRTYFTDICGSNKSKAADVRALLNAVNPDKDVVVSFNWDEEADSILSDGYKDVAYTKGGWKGKGVSLLLKPHGSINWYDISQGVFNDDLYFISDDDDRLRADQRKLVAYTGVERPLQIDRKKYHPPLECPPAIAPPVFAKRFNYVEQHCVWQDVIEVCAEATEFVFLGYRVPRDDFLTRAALRGALTKNPDRIKVLVVLKEGLTDEVRISFGSIFGSAFGKKNILSYNFGTGGSEFVSALEAALSQASL